MSRVNIRLETLTPIHIGSGKAWMPDYEFLFFQTEGKLALIDESKVLNIGVKEPDIVLLEQWISQWVSAIEKEEKLLPLLETRNPGLKPEDIAQRVIEVIGQGPQKSELKEQLHLGTPLRPCIPGSSLKGSIRTALLNQLINDQPEFARNPERLKSGRRKQFNDSQVIANYFGRKDREFHGEYRLDANRDFMRLIRVADTYLDTNTECHQLEIINEYRDGWGKKHKETSYIECIPAHAKGRTSIQIPKKLLKVIQNGRYKKTEMIRKNEHYLNIKPIFSLVNKLTAKLLGEEISFWEEEENPTVIGQYLDVLSEIKGQLDNLSEEECIIRVGAASGWAFMTGAWPKREDLLDDDTWEGLRRTIQRRNYPNYVPAPKTRKLLAGGMPLGFLKLNLNNQ